MMDSLRTATSVRVGGGPELRVRERYETHSAIVLLAGEYALKVRKPVRLPFLDYSTRARRCDATDAELALGRRISPWVYLGAWSLVVGTLPTLIQEARRGEPALAMTALHARRRLDVLVARSKAPRVPARFDDVADFCAALHARCPVDRSPDGWGNVDNTWNAWSLNFSQLPDDDPTVPLAASERQDLVDGTRHWWQAHVDVMRQRVLEGRVREGHGDLRIEHVYLGARISLIDPLEFSQHLRFADVASEVGFIAMELREAGRADLAHRFVERYAAATQDASLRSVLPFFVRYRAVVRGKVEWIRATQLTGRERARALERSRALFQLAYRATL